MTVANTAENRPSGYSEYAMAPFRRTLIKMIVVLGAALALVGCSHYRVGTGANLAFETLYVAPVANDTLLPQAVAPVSTQIRQALLHDGRVRLVSSPEEADATLEIKLTRYDRTPLASRRDDTGLARTFGLELVALCTLTDNRSDRVLFADRAVQANRRLFTDSGQLQAEYQALPLLAEDLGAAVTHAVVDVW